MHTHATPRDRGGFSCAHRARPDLRQVPVPSPPTPCPLTPLIALSIAATLSCGRRVLTGASGRGKRRAGHGGLQLEPPAPSTSRGLCRLPHPGRSFRRGAGQPMTQINGQDGQPGTSGARGAGTSLEPDRREGLETSVRSYSVQQSPAQRSLHAKHRRDRDSIIAALEVSLRPGLARRAARIEECCRFPRVAVRDESDLVLCLQRCRDRMCPLCADARGRSCTAKTYAICHEMDSPRFITLTLRADGATLLDRVDRLMRAFRRLRKDADWKKAVDGGIYAIEVTWNPKTHQWHPHLHVIAQGRYYPHAKLKRAWLSITGDSSIVHLRMVHDRRTTSRYISRYISKPNSLGHWPAERIAEYAEAMHGRRMIHTFGCSHKRKVEGEIEEPARSTLGDSFSLLRIAMMASAGDQEAVHVRDVLLRRGKEWQLALGYDSCPNADRGPPIEDWEVRRCIDLIPVLEERWIMDQDATGEQQEYAEPDAPDPRQETFGFEGGYKR